VAGTTDSVVRWHTGRVQRATLLFRNGHVFDGHVHRPGHGLAVAGDRVLGVLPEEDLADLQGPGVEVVDLAGGLVLPGFQDAHVHPVQGGVERLRCDLSGLATPQEYLTAVRSYVEAHPDRPWVLGGGWAMPAFGPSGPRARDLDAVVGDRPVFLPNRDHHGAWVSSAALRLAGVDASTPDPPDGRIERGPDGAPTGTLHEGATALVERTSRRPPTRSTTPPSSSRRSTSTRSASPPGRTRSSGSTAAMGTLPRPTSARCAATG
jgi:predicted amidohydrolase YtcJ